jgi:HTH-type transcriptional regulator/antitoxin HigA
MERLKYTIIRSKQQYDKYCKILEILLDSRTKNKLIRELKAKDLADWLGMSKGYVSDILHYKKGLSKEVIRKLAERFKIRQDAFNRPYNLKSLPLTPRSRPARAVTLR